jgi:hypothetical protein
VDNLYGIPSINKVFTINGLKFKSNLTAFGGYYYLLSDEALYFLPSRRPNKIHALGTRIPIDKEVMGFDVIYADKGMLYIFKIGQKNKIFLVKQRLNKQLSCIFTEGGCLILLLLLLLMI